MNVQTNLNVTKLKIESADISSANFNELSILGSKVASVQYVESELSNMKTLRGKDFDFQDMKGVYNSLSSIIYGLGGTVSNFPEFLS